MLKLSALYLALAAGVAALPEKVSSRAGGRTDYLSTFEDLGARSFIGPYNGLSWGSIALVTSVTLGQQTPVKPRSPPRFAKTIINNSNITTVYRGSVSSSFDLQSLYYGCSSTTAGTLAASNCTITAYGFKANRVVASQSLPFVIPAGAATTNVPMQRATFGRAFNGVDTVRFKNSVVQSTFDGISLDNVQYSVYTK